MLIKSGGSMCMLTRVLIRECIVPGRQVLQWGGRSCRCAICRSGQHDANSCSLTSRMAAFSHLCTVTISSQPPVCSPHFCAAADTVGSNCWKSLVNSLKCFSAQVYFNLVIHYFPCAFYGCWREDYCTYRSYFISVSFCCFCEVKWNVCCCITLHQAA